VLPWLQGLENDLFYKNIRGWLCPSLFAKVRSPIERRDYGMGDNAVISESAFDECVDDSFEKIEVAVDDSDADIDFDTSGGVLTIYCDDGSQIIFSRQTAQRQLWMAAKSGGFHYHYDNDSGRWISTRAGDSLQQEFERTFQAQTKHSITIKL
jgi:CyaY protein